MKLKNKRLCSPIYVTKIVIICLSYMQRDEYDRLVILGLNQAKKFNWNTEAGNLYSHLKFFEKS